MKGQEMKRLWDAITTVIRAIYNAEPRWDGYRRPFYPTPVYRSAASEAPTVPVELYAPKLRHFELIGGKN